MPWVLELITPASIVDVGCGSGEWLAVAAARGVTDILGIDGPWVAPATLSIPPEHYLAADLAAPLDLGRSFDLALCLEVAEHLPPERGPTLVESLTTVADVVLFSAAVPGQGGEGHVHEAWPSYWCAEFAARRFVCLDVVRPLIWVDDSIEPWYRQNLLLFAADAYLARLPKLQRLAAATPSQLLDIVHPELFASVEGERTAALDAVSRLESICNDLQAAYAEARRAECDLREQIDSLRQSRSWRLTAPLRMLSSRFRRKEP